MTDVYLQLSYDEYKLLEDQLRDWSRIETNHTSVDGYYHKALRLRLGELTLEIQGPAVKAPVVTNVGPDQQDQAHELAHEHARNVAGA